MSRYLLSLLLIAVPLSADSQKIEPAAREGTLWVLSFGVGAPMEGPPVDDLYGRDAGFVAEALKRSPSAWTQVETTFVSGLACTPERLRTELKRLGTVARTNDLVVIHASTHGTTKNGLLQLDGEKGTVIDANGMRDSRPTRTVVDEGEGGALIQPHGLTPPDQPGGRPAPVASRGDRPKVALTECKRPNKPRTCWSSEPAWRD